MEHTTIAVDLAKSLFQIAVSQRADPGNPRMAAFSVTCCASQIPALVNEASSEPDDVCPSALPERIKPLRVAGDLNQDLP